MSEDDKGEKSTSGTLKRKDRSDREDKPSKRTSNRDDSTKSKKKSDSVPVPPVQWMMPPNQVNMQNPNMPAMFLPGMMLPTQFPPIMMPFVPPEDEERLKAFQKAMASVPFNAFPNKMMPPNVMVPPIKQAPLKKKKKLKSDDAVSVSASTSTVDLSKRELHEKIQEQLFNKMNDEMKSQDPHLYRLINIPGLFVSISEGPRNSLARQVDKLLDSKSISSQQRTIVKNFLSDFNGKKKKKIKKINVNVEEIYKQFNSVMSN